MSTPMTMASLPRVIRRLRPWLSGVVQGLVPAVLMLTSITLAGPVQAVELRFPTAPTTAVEAWQTLAERRLIVTRFKACGEEIKYRGTIGTITESPGEIPSVVAKMLWLLLHPDSPPDAGKPPPPPSDEIIVRHHDDPEDIGRYPGERDPDAPTFIPIQMQPPLELTPGMLPPFPGVNCEHPADLPPELATTRPSDKDVADAPTNADAKAKVDAWNATLEKWILNENNQFANVFAVVVVGCRPPGCLNVAPACSTILVKDGLGAKYVVTPSCMRLQINLLLSLMKKKDLHGSSSLPCYIFEPATKGEWDVTVRELTTVIYLNSRNSPRNILFPEVAKYVSEQLLTLDGPPGPTSYSLFECGNQEHSTGSAQERADERSWLDDTLDSIADVFDWFWKRLALLIVILALLSIVAILAALLGPLAPILAGALVALGTMAAFGRFPETENHLLNIETSRYLKNQEIIASLKSTGDDPDRFEGDQLFVKHFLMSKFQDLLKNDFSEYNARPYSRYSMLAILNIAQFADDVELQDAARAVIQYTWAKAAIGSNRGLRLVPYRRHMEALRSRGYVSLFDNFSNGDHLIPVMMFYTGQTQLLQNNSLQPESTGHMVYYAAAVGGPKPVVPDHLIMEAAIEKARPYEQRIKHAAAEIFSSGDGWLVSAGGIQSGPANFFIAPIQNPVKPLFKDDDRGAAWPTTLILAAATPKALWWEDMHPMEHFIRIEGLKILHWEEPEEEGRTRALDDGKVQTVVSIRRERGHFRGERMRDGVKEEYGVIDNSIETFDGNLCVGMGFACGFNVELPAPFDLSVSGCGDVRGNWTFFDTDKCYPETREHWRRRSPRGVFGKIRSRRVFVPRRPGATRVFIAVAREQCPVSVSGKCRNFGILEAITAGDPALAKSTDEKRYDDFMAIVQENQSLGLRRAAMLSSADVVAEGTYRAVKQNERGERISIRYEADISESSSLSRVVSIDGVERPSHGSWKTVEGDFINSPTPGRIEIGWRGRGASPARLILDLSYYRPDTVLQTRRPSPIVQKR